MAGTIDGGKAAAATNKLKFGADFYRKIGSAGGRQTAASGKLALVNFTGDKERARYYGSIGGSISRRGKAKQANG